VPDPVQVAIVEDQRDIREGLKFLIDGTPGYRCTGAFGSMEEALPAVDPDRADIVLMDLGLPGMSGLEGIRRFKERYPGLHLVALTVYEDDERIFEALARASGYLLKKTACTASGGRLQEVCRGAPMFWSRAPRHHALSRVPPAVARRAPAHAARSVILGLSPKATATRPPPRRSAAASTRWRSHEEHLR
jgi:DNA-binding NarL/FixJ family response regulator